MRVVQVVPDYGLGGIQKAGCVLADGLARLGHEAVVVGSEGGPRYLGDETRDHLHHAIVETDSAERLAEAVLDHQPDAVHIHAAAYEEPLIEQLARKSQDRASAPLVVATPVFGRPPSDRATLDRCRTAVVGTYIHYRLRNWLNLGVTEAFRRGVAFTPVVSYQTTDPPQSTLDPPEVRAARRESLGIPADAEVLGRVGRASPVKWSPANQQLVDRFLTERPRGVWLSVGYTEEAGRAALSAKWGDRFRDLPQSSDYNLLAKCYATMDLQAFFSQAGECFAATICEPAGAGLPTIAGTNPSRDNGQSEQVVDGVTGYLVTSVDEAADRAASLFDAPDELDGLKRSTVEYAVARWTPERVVGDLIEFLEAQLSDDPLAHPYTKRCVAEAEAFSADYVPRMLRLHASGPISSARWRLQLAAVRSWEAFSLAGRLKRALRG